MILDLEIGESEIGTSGHRESGNLRL